PRSLAKYDIDLDDDFLQNGGDSLSALELILGIRTEANVDLPVSDIYTYPTVRRLAQSLTQGAAIRPSKGSGNWKADVTLVEGISVPARIGATPPKEILLTGATGFLGAHLLSALLRSTSARITALVRAADETAAFQRCRSALERHGLWEDAVIKNLSVLKGDLSKPKLGVTPVLWKYLTHNIDSIVHCGAMVDLLRSYNEHRPHNVLGTIELIKLATTYFKKHLHYISTFSLFDVQELEQNHFFVGESEVPMA